MRAFSVLPLAFLYKIDMFAEITENTRGNLLRDILYGTGKPMDYGSKAQLVLVKIIVTWIVAEDFSASAKIIINLEAEWGG